MDFCLTLAAGGIESFFANIMLATEGLWGLFLHFSSELSLQGAAFHCSSDLSRSFLIHIQKVDPEKLVESVKISRQGGQ